MTFLISYFCVTKSTKSHQRERSPLFENSSRVHESVVQAMRGKYVRQGGRVKVGSIALSAISTIPRVRTYHTRKPSRFVHALPARPLKVQGGRESNMYADGMERVYFGLVQIALFTNKKLRQEILGFPALYFAY